MTFSIVFSVKIKVTVYISVSSGKQFVAKAVIFSACRDNNQDDSCLAFDYKIFATQTQAFLP